ncbi:hypothetical protein EI94DRAFT_1733002 [Lactarius quietus]|nr:hypothetical protein EI94DRAFT_1733002 [Lactarius quietus]
MPKKSKRSAKKNPWKYPKRSGKRGQHWTFNELDTYNIRINTVDTKAFFGIPELPAPVVDPIILNHVTAPVDLQLPRALETFFGYLHDTTLNVEVWVDDFALHLLGSLLRLNNRGGPIHLRPELPFVMNGCRVLAVPNLAIYDNENYPFFLFHRDKSSQDRAEPRPVASALGAFYTINFGRTAVGLPPLPSKMYIGMIMIRSAPRFYKITITQALADAVMTPQFPIEETIMERFVPPVPNMDEFLVEGMQPLENRRVCFQSFEALRTLNRVIVPLDELL